MHIELSIHSSLDFIDGRISKVGFADRLEAEVPDAEKLSESGVLRFLRCLKRAAQAPDLISKLFVPLGEPVVLRDNDIEQANHVVQDRIGRQFGCGGRAGFSLSRRFAGVEGAVVDLSGLETRSAS